MIRQHLLVDVAGSAVRTQRSAAFDQTILLAPLVLEQTQTGVTTGAAATAKAARCTGPAGVDLTGDPRIAELYTWLGTFDPDNEPSVRFGIVNANANLDGHIGDDANGYGLALDTTGRVFHNGVPSGPLGAVRPGIGVYVGIEFIPDDGTLRFVMNQSQDVAYIEGIDYVPWYLAVSIRSYRAGDVHALLNSGLSRWNVWPVTPYRTPSRGWLIPGVARDPYRLADVSFRSLPTDDPPNALWKGSITPESSLTVSRFLKFWQWGDVPTPNSRGASNSASTSNTQRATGAFMLSNGNGAFDSMLSGLRDANVMVRIDVPAGGSYLNATGGVLALAVDSCEGRDDNYIAMSLTNRPAKFDSVASRTEFVYQTSQGPQMKLRQLVIGEPNSVPLVAVNAEQEQYAIGDSSSVGATVLRDKGYPYKQGATPPDWIRATNGDVIIARDLVGVGTADIRSFNCALAANGGVASASSELSPTYAATHLNDGDRATTAWIDATPNVFPDYAQIQFSAAQLIDRIVVYFPQDSFPASGEPTDTMTGSLVPSSFDVKVELGGVWTTIASVTGNNLVKRTFTFPPILSMTVRVVVNATLHVSGRTDITEIEAWTHPERTFADVVGALTDRGGDAISNASDADTAAAYTGGVGYCALEDVTVGEILSDASASFNACVAADANNVLRVYPLVDTRTMPTPALALSQEDMLADLQIWDDLALNLTTRAQGQKNVQPITDFATDASITSALRDELSADYRISRTYSGALAEMYAAARNQKPQGTMLNLGDDVQRFIERGAGIYQYHRMFARAPFKWRTDVDLGTPCVLSYKNNDGQSRYGLGAGVKALIVGIEQDVINKLIYLTFWFARED